MRRTSGSSIPQIAVQLYSVLLLAYPEAHRREYGPSMAQAFRDLWWNASLRGNLIGRLWLAGEILADTAVNAVLEHSEVLKERNLIMTRQQHSRIIVGSALPIAVGIFLWVLNPNYMRHMLATGPAQPAGWLMTAAVLGLAAAAYLIQRKINIQLQLTASDQAVGGGASHLRRTRNKDFALFLISLFLILPAVLLMVLGPAYMTVVEFLQK